MTKKCQLPGRKKPTLCRSLDYAKLLIAAHKNENQECSGVFNWIPSAGFPEESICCLLNHLSISLYGVAPRCLDIKDAAEDVPEGGHVPEGPLPVVLVCKPQLIKSCCWALSDEVTIVVGQETTGGSVIVYHAVVLLTCFCKV